MKPDAYARKDERDHKEKHRTAERVTPSERRSPTESDATRGHRHQLAFDLGEDPLLFLGQRHVLIIPYLPARDNAHS